ncbi:alpha/beta hydrolase family protein [Dactylosporangium sp. NPDC000521]|uniref:alpha/beta hydrolase family protein n=1 Tax=Dactylosporangium sp. NPDC000521 TaxID=3363975 RepID=UPI0036A01E71
MAAASAAVAAVPAPASAADLPAPGKRTGGAAKRLVLPAPTGRHHLGTVALHLADRSRPDPWVPAERVRELMVQLWYPAPDARRLPLAPWVSPAFAALVNPPGSGYELPLTHARLGAPALPGRRPVVLYSPGFGVERTASTAVAEELASHGYIVVTIDHTHDSPLVEFPDGRVARSAVPPPTGEPGEEDRLIAKALAARVADTRFVLDWLARPQRALPSGLWYAMDQRAIGMIGHSLGGTTAAETMLEDGRVKAGCNLDGAMSGRVMTEGLDRPFLLVGSEGHGRAGDETWAAFWAVLRGPRLELQLRDSGHMSFTDYQVLLPQAGIPAEDLVEPLGTIDGDRSVRVQRAYLLAWADRRLSGRRGTLLDGPCAAFPEMRFLP